MHYVPQRHPAQLNWLLLNKGRNLDSIAFTCSATLFACVCLYAFGGECDGVHVATVKQIIY